jgi:hypothetical protein
MLLGMKACGPFYPLLFNIRYLPVAGGSLHTEDEVVSGVQARGCRPHGQRLLRLRVTLVLLSGNGRQSGLTVSLNGGMNSSPPHKPDQIGGPPLQQRFLQRGKQTQRKCLTRTS